MSQKRRGVDSYSAGYPTSVPMERRVFLGLLGGIVAAPLLKACGAYMGPYPEPDADPTTMELQSFRFPATDALIIESADGFTLRLFLVIEEHGDALQGLLGQHPEAFEDSVRQVLKGYQADAYAADAPRDHAESALVGRLTELAASRGYSVVIRRIDIFIESPIEP